MFREKEELTGFNLEQMQSIATRNACKLCSPLGGCLVLKGIRGCLPMLHGSQGCATYIRRYNISHFREPVDIASSNFSEESTIFGGGKNFATGIDNIINQYNPEVIGIASTCLSETIGEDIAGLIKLYCTSRFNKKLPRFIHISTPSYKGTHMDGFHITVLAVVKSAIYPKYKGNHINLFPGFVSPADIRHLKNVIVSFGLKAIVLPDYSETLDGTNWKEYHLIPEGGVPIGDIDHVGSAKVTIELGKVFYKGVTAGTWLKENNNVENTQLPLPIGIRQTDAFIKTLEDITGKPATEHLQKKRGRLIDAYVDGHKYVFSKKAMVYGEEDLVISLVAFLSEIGIKTILAGSGGNTGKLKQGISEVLGKLPDDMEIVSDMDFEYMNSRADKLIPDLFIGNSKGYYIARRLKKPLIRVGFPIHDRFGGQRLQHLGYEGTQQLYDRIVNALIEYDQKNSLITYKYI